MRNDDRMMMSRRRSSLLLRAANCCCRYHSLLLEEEDSVAAEHIPPVPSVPLLSLLSNSFSVKLFLLPVPLFFEILFTSFYRLIRFNFFLLEFRTTERRKKQEQKVVQRNGLLIYPTPFSVEWNGNRLITTTMIVISDTTHQLPNVCIYVCFCFFTLTCQACDVFQNNKIWNNKKGIWRRDPVQQVECQCAAIIVGQKKKKQFLAKKNN